jgi:hypothetical protein
MRYFEYFFEFQNILLLLTVMTIISMYIYRKLHQHSELVRVTLKEIWTSLLIH